MTNCTLCKNEPCVCQEHIHAKCQKEITDLRSRLAEAQARNAQILRDFHAEIHDGQGESAHDVIQRLVREKQEATARAERAEGERDVSAYAAYHLREMLRVSVCPACANVGTVMIMGESNPCEWCWHREQALTPSSQRSDGEVDERARFEKWAEAYGMNISRSVIEKDSYLWSNTRDAWTGWMAAMEATAPEVKGGAA